MRNSLALAALALLVFPAAARADELRLHIVTGAAISSPGRPTTLLAEQPFTFGSGENTATIAFKRLFTDESFSTSIPVPSSLSFGEFTVSFTGSGATIPDGTVFHLQFFAFQVSPVIGSYVDSILGTLSGTIGPGGSATLTFPDRDLLLFLPTLVGGTFLPQTVVAVRPNAPTLTLAPGVTDLPGQVSIPVPEPATLLLLVTGLAGAAVKARRGRRA